MKNLLYTFISLMLIILSTANTLPGQNDIRYCSYEGKKLNKEDICATMGYMSTDEVEKIIDNILKQLGLHRNFGVLECRGADNCMAYRQGNMQYIIYDPDFLSKVRTMGFTESNIPGGGVDWVALGILAHEIGHLLNQHLMISLSSTPANELQADEFSGFVLAKLGATLAQAQKAMRSPKIPVQASYTHPAKADRLAAIKKGWRRGGGNEVNETNDADEKRAIREIAEAKRLLIAGIFDKGYQLLHKNRKYLYSDDIAMNMFGLIYTLGDEEGLPADYKEALIWFKKAAEMGNTDAMINIGDMYKEGYGVPEDYSEAMRWYKKAAELGDTDAMSTVGDMYKDGKGAERDLSEAMRWFKKAADKGEVTAMNSIGYMYKYGNGVPLDYIEAMRWFKKAAELGDSYAMTVIGEMYYKGLGVPSDYSEAIRWYKKAARKGNPPAIMILRQLGESW